MSELQEQLNKILQTMDVPKSRFSDYNWLLRNLFIRNSEHPNFRKAVDLIKRIIKE
jgi:hypothetical protein